MTIYAAKIVGDICPGSTITINTAWSGAGSGPTVEVIDHVLLVESIPEATGVLTVSGSVDCNGENIAIGPITLTITDSSNDPGDPGGGGGSDPG